MSIDKTEKYRYLTEWLEEYFITNGNYKYYPNRDRILKKLPLISNYAENFFKYLNNRINSANSNIITVVKTLLGLDQYLEFKMSKINGTKSSSDYWEHFKYKNLVTVFHQLKDEKSFLILDKLTESYLWDNDDNFLNIAVQNEDINIS